jgi:hypothetical protein
VKASEYGLYFDCSDGQHYLIGQADDERALHRRVSGGVMKVTIGIDDLTLARVVAHCAAGEGAADFIADAIKLALDELDGPVAIEAVRIIDAGDADEWQFAEAAP